jgi:hypothetical protein
MIKEDAEKDWKDFIDALDEAGKYVIVDEDDGD